MNFYRPTHQSGADCRVSANQCPRCGSQAFERLRSYAHCSECLYAVDFDVPAISVDYTDAMIRSLFLISKKGKK